MQRKNCKALHNNKFLQVERRIHNTLDYKGCLNDSLEIITLWLGWVDSNHRMTVSKTVALPLGYTPRIQNAAKLTHIILYK